VVKSNKPWKAAAFVGVIGVDLAVMTLAGFWTGRYVDRLWGSDPVFLIIGVLLGLGLGIFSVIRMIKPFLGEDND
jgi:F0F1-type ATP synthase assembly protein I